MSLIKLAEFKEQTTIIAKDQPAYLPLPAFEWKNAEGTITFCWQLTWKQRLKVLFTGLLWHDVLTFNQPLQPQRLSDEKPPILYREDLK